LLAAQLVLPLADRGRRDLAEPAPAEARAQVTAEAAVGGREGGRAPVRICRPALPPLIGPLVEGEPAGDRVEVAAVELGRLDLDEEPFGLPLGAEAPRVLLALRILIAGDVGRLPVASTLLDVGH